MNFNYQTERLILSVGEEAFAPLVLDYLSRNSTDFEPYERKYAENYYSLDYQTASLSAERQLLLQGRGVRFYIFLKDNPDFIIGNVSFAYLNEDQGHRATIGYRMDRDYRQNGYAFEAVSFLLPIISKEYHLKRIEADILPDNEPSIALIKKLGFEYEGIARKSHEVAGLEQDHLRFSLII